MITPEAKGRNWAGNQAYRTLLLDGFLAGLWKAEAGVLTVELFAPASKAAKEEIVAEGELLLAAMEEGPQTPSGRWSVRFGSIHG